ncbi:MAG: DUF169 domain-containing protein [Candidatus Latescibacterota bacterium]
MNEIKYLEKLTGEKWTGVRFSETAKQTTHPFAMLCEAVNASFKENLIVECAELSCLGARYSLGLERNENRMVHRMSERAVLSEEHARKIILSTPHLEEHIGSIEIGMIEHPNVLVSFLKPLAAMLLLRRWQQYAGSRLSISLSAFTALCATVADAHVEDKLVFSFGCPDSRAYGGITEEKMIAAMPFGLAVKLADDDE